MIGEFERYHGAAIRDLVVGCGAPVRIEASDDEGRVNTFILNRKIGVHIKHSASRLPPWQFTYADDNLAEIERLKKRSRSVWLIHVCGQDGFVALTYDEFRSINSVDAETTRFVRVDRDRNTMYRVNGTDGKLGRSKRRGLNAIFEELKG
jgi:hypothetical protein